jgi:hypothetical protein
MIVAVVTFLSAGAPVTRYRWVDAFETRAECEAMLSAEAPRLMAVAVEASSYAGRVVAVTAACVDMEPMG